MERITVLLAELAACCAISEARTCKTVRGAARLTEISSLPVIDKAATAPSRTARYNKRNTRYFTSSKNR